MSVDIKMVRGDTKFICFTRKTIDGEPILEKADEIYFTVKRSPINTGSREFLIQKTLDDMDFDTETGKYSFTIEPEDTDALSFMTYKYDLQVTHDDIKKTVARGNLIVQEEVTFAANEAGGE